LQLILESTKKLFEKLRKEKESTFVKMQSNQNKL